VFLISCLFCFCFLVCFAFVFYLGLRSLFIFLWGFFFNAYFIFHVAKLSSFDPSKLSSSVKDRCKDHLVDGGLSLPYKKRAIWIKYFKIRSGLEKSGKMVIVNEPCWFKYRCLWDSENTDLDKYSVLVLSIRSSVYGRSRG